MPSDRQTDPKPDETEAETALREPTHSSRIPPSDPGPYERAMHPDAPARGPALTGKILYYGGAGVLAAAATAAVILAARKLTERDRHAPAARHPRRERTLAPRFAELSEAEREEIRRHAREQARADRNRAARLRAMAARERAAPRRNVARDLTETADNLSGSIHGLIGALTSALTGFRQVAQQAGGIMRDFSDAADGLRDLMERPGDRSKGGASPDAAEGGAVADESRPRDRTHRL